MDITTTTVKNLTTKEPISSSNDILPAFISSIGNDNGVGGSITGPTREDNKNMSRVGPADSAGADQNFKALGENYVAPSKNENGGYSISHDQFKDIEAGFGGRIATAAIEYEQTKDNTHTDVRVVSGEEYLAQQALAAKEAQATKKATAAEKKISDEQTISHNGTATGLGTGEDIGGGN